jgi:hypothetical protein
MGLNAGAVGDLGRGRASSVERASVILVEVWWRVGVMLDRLRWWWVVLPKADGAMADAGTRTRVSRVLARDSSWQSL